jgi:hypothetical protein
VRAAVDPLERELLEIVLQFPHLFGEAASVIQPAQIVSGSCRAVFSQCAQLHAAEILPDYERLLLEIDDPVVKNLLVELDVHGRSKGAADAEVRLRDVLAGFERRRREQGFRGRTAALKQRQLAEDEELALLVELEEHQRARQREQEERSRLDISEPTEG